MSEQQTRQRQVAVIDIPSVVVWIATASLVVTAISLAAIALWLFLYGPDMLEVAQEGVVEAGRVADGLQEVDL